jgi:hypothetical protein
MDVFLSSLCIQTTFYVKCALFSLTGLAARLRVSELLIRDAILPAIGNIGMTRQISKNQYALTVEGSQMAGKLFMDKAPCTRLGQWAPEYGGSKGRVTTMLGNHSEKLKIAGRIELDQCFSAPRFSCTNRSESGSVGPYLERRFST